MVTFQTLHEKKFGGLQIVNVPSHPGEILQTTAEIIGMYIFGFWHLE